MYAYVHLLLFLGNCRHTLLNIITRNTCMCVCVSLHGKNRRYIIYVNKIDEMPCCGATWKYQQKVAKSTRLKSISKASI